MDTIRIRQGETEEFIVEIDDDLAESVSIIVKDLVSDVSPLIYESANFVDGVASLILEGSVTSIAVGDYIYQLTVVYSDGSVDKFPDPSVGDCGDECDFPEFIICAALDPGVS